VIVTAHPQLWRNPIRRRKRQKKTIFYLHNKLKKEDLDEVFNKSRSGTIAHKNKKRSRPVLSQKYFGTILRYYFLVGAEIVPRNGLCDRKKKSA
jgi:hypothetical protein